NQAVHGEPLTRDGIVWTEQDRSAEISHRGRPVPIEGGLDASERRQRLGEVRFPIQCAFCRSPRPRHHFGRTLNAVDRKRDVSLRQTRMCKSIIRVFRERFLKLRYAVFQTLPGSFVPVISSLEVKLEGFRSFRAL